MSDPTVTLASPPADTTIPSSAPDSNEPFDLDALAETTTNPAEQIEDADAPSEPEKPQADKPEAEPEKKDEAETEKDGEDEEETSEEPKPKKASGSARLKSRIAVLEAQLAERDASRPPAAGGVDAQKLDAAVVAEIGPPPKESDYADFLAFERALTAYESATISARMMIRRELAAETGRTERVARERTATVLAEHQERLDQLETALPGARKKIETAGADLQVAPHVGQLVLESEKSAHLQLHLVEHPEKLAELNRMPPLMAAKALGALEARLSLPKPRTATNAPTPPKAVKGAASPSSPDADLSAWLKRKYG